jgi:hypothetical protein
MLTRSIFVVWALLLSRCFPGAASEAIWNPLAKQSVEPDTLYLLDVEAERRLAPGDGGLIGGDATLDPWRAQVVPVPGKYRTGLKSMERRYGYLWMPSIGLISPQEFTIELWLKCDRPWAEVTDNSPLLIADERGSVDLRFQVDRGSLKLVYRHLQDPAGPVRAEIARNLSQSPLPAETWVNVAATFKDRTLRLYLNRTLVGEKSGINAPRVWSDAARGDGLCLLGGFGRGATDFALSDLRISRRARVPGEPVPAGTVRGPHSTADNRLVVGMASPTGQTVRQTLLGGLHRLPNRVTEAMAQGALRVLRTDKLLVATPIKAGPPDDGHPAPGISGRYSYDWQVVDRGFEYYRQLGITPYISLDATPQLLGGSVAPYQGAQLLQGYAWSSMFPREIPNDMEAFGALVQDLVHHVVQERHGRVPYWGVWNEPNGKIFWDNSLDNYLRLYEACARAVKRVSPDLKVGGPETGDWDPQWVEGLVQRCAERKLPLDFISWHYYQNTVSEIPRARAQLDDWSRKHGLGHSPELIIGEWCWQIHNFPGSGYLPWKTRNYFLNDWHAAFVAASLIEMQNAGVVYSIYTNPVAENGQSGFKATGLMSATHPWANLNVFRLWSRLAPQIVRTSYVGPPGVFAQASRDDQGRLTLLLANLRYRKDAPVELTIQVSGTADGPLPLDARVTHFVVDDQHSNRFDAGPEHTELETVEPPRLAHSVVRISLRPRSVHLLELQAIGDRR